MKTVSTPMHYVLGVDKNAESKNCANGLGFMGTTRAVMGWGWGQHAANGAGTGWGRGQGYILRGGNRVKHLSPCHSVDVSHITHFNPLPFDLEFKKTIGPNYIRRAHRTLNSVLCLGLLGYSTCDCKWSPPLRACTLL